MNPTLINFHQKRFEWTFKAINEFINDLEKYKTESNYQKGLTNSVEGLLRILQTDLENRNEVSCHRLTEFFREAEETHKKELENYEKQLEPYELLLSKQTSIIDHERKEAQFQAEQFLNKMAIYDQYLEKIELNKMDPERIWEVVDGFIEFTPSARKASIINDDAARLQSWVEKVLGASLLKIKQEAIDLKIELRNPLELPILAPIPQIQQKIDSFWLKRTYEKALSNMRNQAHDWVAEMYQHYNHLLSSVLTEIIEQKEQVEQEADTLKHVSIQKINILEHQLVTYQKEEAELRARYLQAAQLWDQFLEQASLFQRYLIKAWLAYKEELQQHFLFGLTEDRFLAAQYLQLLRQDGENIIKSIHKGGDE